MGEQLLKTTFATQNSSFQGQRQNKRRKIFIGWWICQNKDKETVTTQVANVFVPRAATTAQLLMITQRKIKHSRMTYMSRFGATINHLTPSAT